MHDYTKYTTLREEFEVYCRSREDSNLRCAHRNMFNLIAEGYTTEQIHAMRPEAHPKFQMYGWALLAAFQPDLFDELSGTIPKHHFKMLIDENIAYHIVPSLRRSFGHINHADFVGLNGCGKSTEDGDQKLWDWAKDNNIDAIITRDFSTKDAKADLTSIAIREQLHRGAYKTQKLPTIIHVKTVDITPLHIAATLTKHADKIAACIKERKSPYIIVTEKSVRFGKTHETLLAQSQERKPFP